MALNDNSTVSIVINVVDTNSGQVLSATQQRLQGVGASAQQAGVLVDQFGRAFEQAGTSAAALNTQLASVGSTAAATSAQVATGMDRVASSIQGARLAGQDMGLHIPRAMYAIIGANQTLMAGVQALFGVFVAFGAVTIFAQMGKGIYDLYEKWVDVDGVFKEYQAAVEKASDEDIVNVRSLEDAEARMRALTTQAQQLREVARSGQSEGWARIFSGDVVAGVTELAVGHSTAQASTHAAGQADKISSKDVEMQHQINLDQIDTAHAADAALGSQAKITAELQKQLAIHAENQRFDKQMSMVQGNQVSPDSGAAERALKDTAARRQAAAESSNLARKENDEVVQMQDQALDAGLKGEALLEAQKEQAVAAVVRKFNEGEISKQAKMAETAAINLKYDNEKMERLAEQERETQKIERDVQQAGLTGIAKLQAEGANKVADIGADPNLDPAQKSRRQVAAQQTTNNEIVEQQKQFNQRLQEMDQQTDDSMLQGYARIDSETRKHIDEIEKLFQEYYGQLATDDPKRVAAEQAVQQEITNITTQADRERLQEHQKTMEQIAQVEAQAARLTLPPWQAAQQDILDQFNQRVQKETDLINQNAISWEEYCVAIQTDYKLAMAQMEKAAEQTRDQLASQLSSFFSDPSGYLKKRAEDLMFQILANWMLQLMTFNKTAGGLLGGLFGMNGQMSTSTNPGAALGSIFGIHSSTHGAMNESLGIPGGLGTAGTTLTSAGTTLSSAGTTLSSSGTMLTSSATALSSAATALSTAASQMSMSGGGGGAGLGGILGGLSGGAGGGGDAAAGGDWGLGSGDASAPSFTQSPNASFGDLGMSDSNDAAWGDLNVGSSSTSSLDPLGPLGQGDITSGTGTLDTIGEHTDPMDETAGMPDGGFGSDSATGASSLGTVAGGMAAIGGTLAMVNAWKTNNTGAAVLSGAMTGAGIGMMVGGPIGAAIGAVGGALVGWIGSLFGDHGTSKAKQYDQQTVQPALAKELHEFDAGQLGYTQATADLTNLQTQTYNELWGLGSGARHYYTNNILPEFTTAQQQLMQQMQGGRDQVTFSAAQYHDGGTISHFGSLWTSPGTGFIHAKLGETVMNPAASSSFAPVLSMMNSGMLSRGSRMPAASSGSGGSVTIQAWDAKSVDDWLRRGGAQQIQRGLNQNVSRYSGEGLN